MKMRSALVALLIAAPAYASAQSAEMNDSQLSALDKNADGSVSRDEFFQFADYAFKQMDANGDRQLSPNEVDPHVVSDSFQQMDGNGDGAVSTGEFTARMDADFKAADKNGDGMLN